jgi:hypothetical protein
MAFPEYSTIRDLVLTELASAFKVYGDMTGEWPMDGACEGLVQGRIAEHLFNKLRTEKRITDPMVTVESAYKKVAEFANGLERFNFEKFDKDNELREHWRLMDALGRNQRADIVAWEEKKPRAVIEIKLAWKREVCFTDVWRTAAAVYAHGPRPHEGTLNVGITAFCVRDWDTEGGILKDVKDQINERWCDASFPSEWRKNLCLGFKHDPRVRDGPNDGSKIYPFCVTVSPR